MKTKHTEFQPCFMESGTGTGFEANQAATMNAASVTVELETWSAQLQPNLSDSPDTVAITVMEMLCDALEEVLC